MARKQNIFESIKSAYGDMLQESLGKSRITENRRVFALSRDGANYSAHSDMLASKSVASGPLHREGQFQQVLRPPYGKSGTNPAQIGNHPDFNHLLNTENTEYCPITTMFMDMKGSTYLGMLHDPHIVFHIKNTFLSVAIEIVKAFDGHVHRLQGDAVMAYFGGKNRKPEEGVIDALNCVSTLMQIVKRSVIPSLNDQYPDTPLGIRIGLDHGGLDAVLWGCYGHKNMCEVTATSLYVDLAAKLQQSAGANEIMLGETLRAQLDLHDELLSDRQYVLPNYPKRNGEKMNYRQFCLRDDDFFWISPLVPQTGSVFPSAASALSPLKISATQHHRLHAEALGDVFSCGTLVPKERSLAFRLTPPGDVQFPCTVKFRVENHGGQALRQAGAGRDSHRSMEKTVYNFDELASLPPNWETTRYRGLHYLIAEIHRGSVVTHRGVFGVYVE